VVIKVGAREAEVRVRATGTSESGVTALTTMPQRSSRETVEVHETKVVTVIMVATGRLQFLSRDTNTSRNCWHP